MSIFNIYHDSALTQPVASGTPITATQDTLGSIDPVYMQLWYGSDDDTVQAQATSDPGNDDIVITPTDNSSGEPITAIKLATTYAGLSSATGGASLAVGTTVAGGTGGMFSFWIQIDDSTATVGSYTNLSLESNDVDVSPV